MKKYFLFLFFCNLCLQFVIAGESLEMAIKNKDWRALAKLFNDDSHQQLVAYFKECRGIGFNQLRQNDLMFFARFQDFGEIGEITYELENGNYRQLKLKRDIKPLYFINSFARFDIADRTIRMGDAEIYFKNGSLYRGLPMGNMFIFSGEWEFKIRPSNENERLTLLSLVRDETFKKELRVGIFILSKPEKLAGLPVSATVSSVNDEEAKFLYEIFQKNWGMHISFFNELWYFPFAVDFDAVIFPNKSGKSYFRYIFNSVNSIDTSLVLYPENKLYLNYNAVKGLKFVSQSIDELENLQLNLFYNPQVSFLSATSVLNFKEPSNVKQINLNNGLVVKGYGKSREHELQLFHREDTYFLLGQELNKFSFYYAGNIDASGEASELLKINFKMQRNKNSERYYVLSRDQNFYPNPGHHFFKSRVKISLPFPMQCLASGNLKSQQKLGDRTEYIFESPGSKGVSLVCGNFEKLLTVPGKIPVHVYGNRKLRIKDFFSVAEIQKYFDFLLDKFGLLDIRELNLLLRHLQDFGGQSNQGFVIFNLMDNNILGDDLSVIRRFRTDSPVVFTNINKDNLIHELAHQWWGGIISWKSYQDQWLTEGLAQFSTLYYLKNTLGKNQFSKVIASAQKWVFRNSSAGPVIYGRRIANLSDDLNTYQSIIYNKAALVFLMLQEILGEQETLKRLRQILVDFKYKSLASARFIQYISQGDRRLKRFFDGWVYSRLIPEVSYVVSSAGNNAAITFSQKNSDFVFPVNVLVTTAEGNFVHPLVIEEKVQKFELIENAPIQSVKVDAGVAPIKLLD